MQMKTQNELFQGSELDINSVLEHYENQVRKNGKWKVHLDNEDVEESKRVRRHRYQHKHKARPRKNEKQIGEITNDEDISIEIDESRGADPEIPPQLLIKVGKKVRLAGEGETQGPVKAVIEVERERDHHHHHKHGHVRQH